VESDATPPPPDTTVSFEITPEMTQGGDQVADEDTDIDEDQGPVMGEFQDSIAVGRVQSNISL